MIKLKLFLIVLLLFVSMNFSSALSMTISIPEKYSEVRAGERIYFETYLKYPENDIRKDLRIEYFVKDESDNEITYLKVLKAVETQASFMENLVIPESTSSGKYVLSAKVSDYESLNEEIAVSFNVKKKYDSFQNFIFIGFGVVLFIAILIIAELFILIKRRR